MVCALVCAWAMAGCSSSSTATSSSSSTTTTTTTLTASSSSTTTGTSVTLTATVSPSAASGTVTFYSGSTSLGTATLSSGTATLATSFSTSGTYSITAVYTGSTSYASSTSSAISIVVSSSTATENSTTTSLAVNPSPAYPGALTVLTATVSASAATGTVTFYSGSTSLGTAALSSGTAALATTFSSTGTYALTATYGGDSTYSGSTSSAVSETVSTPNYPLTFSSYSGTCNQSMSVTTYSSASDTTGTVHTITYCVYKNVVYAANPDLYKYESMNVFVPTTVDGTAVTVSSSSTPILLDNCIGGYMSCSVYGNTQVQSTNGQYFLANGYVVVEVGARGRDVADSSGVYGAAPAGIVDLKAAVRWMRYNQGSFPGDTNLIFSSGGSAGGAMSSLLGASGNSSLYNGNLASIGAAYANDNVYGTIAYSPITNLDHADMAYEEEYGSFLSSGSCATVSTTLADNFATYQDGLVLNGSYHSSAHSTSTYPYGTVDGYSSAASYGTVSSSKITDYILNVYMIPSVEMYLASLSSTARSSYLSSNSWITYTAASGSTTASATFTFSDYVKSGIGSRAKAVPAFDSFYGYSSALSCENTSETAEINEFGDGSSSSAYAHFTNFSSEATGGSAISSSQQTRVNMMNPMYFITTNLTNLAASGSTVADVSKFWYIRDGSIATDTSAYVIMDLSTGLETLFGTYESSSTWSVNAWENWGQGHNVNADPWDMITWVKNTL